MSKKPPKIPRQRTGSGGWPDRRRVPPPGKKGGFCGLIAFGTLGMLGAAGYGTAEALGALLN